MRDSVNSDVGETEVDDRRMDKQRTAYEEAEHLVGSEMGIGDSYRVGQSVSEEMKLQVGPNPE